MCSDGSKTYHEINLMTVSVNQAPCLDVPGLEQSARNVASFAVISGAIVVTREAIMRYCPSAPRQRVETDSAAELMGKRCGLALARCTCDEEQDCVDSKRYIECIVDVYSHSRL